MPCLDLGRSENRDDDAHGESDEHAEHPANPPRPFNRQERPWSRMQSGAIRPSTPVRALDVFDDLVERQVWIVRGIHRLHLEVGWLSLPAAVNLTRRHADTTLHRHPPGCMHPRIPTRYGSSGGVGNSVRSTLRHTSHALSEATSRSLGGRRATQSGQSTILQSSVGEFETSVRPHVATPLATSPWWTIIL